MADPVIFTAVRVVCRERAVGSLLHVERLIQKALAPDLRLLKAIRIGGFHLFMLALHALDSSSQSCYHEKLQQYRRAMSLVCTSFPADPNVLEAIKQLYTRYPGIFNTRTLDSVLVLGNLSVLQWLYTTKPEIVCKKVWHIFTSASRSGRDDVVKWLHGLFPRVTYTLREAAMGGHLDQIKWLVEHARWDESSIANAVEAAARQSDLELVKFLHLNATAPYTISAYYLYDFATAQWLHEKGVVKDWELMPYCSAFNGQLDTMRWLHSNDQPGFSLNVMDQAARYGHLELVQWLHFNRPEGCTTKAMDDAARNGHLKVVQWLHENRHEGCTTAAMDSAASNGHMDILEWLYANRQEGIGRYAVVFAVQENRFDILKWLHKHYGARGSIDDAVRTGNLEMVKWLHFHGDGEYSKGAMASAVWNGRLDIMKFLHKNRADAFDKNAIRYAAACNSIEEMKWLMVHYRKYYKLATVTAAATYGNLEMLKYILQLRNGWRLESDVVAAMSGAAAKGQFHVMKFLQSEFPTRWSKRVMKAAIRYGDMDIVRWLYAHANASLYPGCELDAAHANNVGALEFIRTNWDLRPNLTIYFSARCKGRIEVELWYVEHFGRPNKRRRV